MEALSKIYEVRKLKQDNVDEVVDFVTKYYSPRNPLGQIFRVDLDYLRTHDEMRVREKIKDNASLGCYEKASGRLIATAFATIHDKKIEAVPRTDAALGGDNPAFQTSKRFLQWLERDLYGTLNTNKFMMTGLGATHPDYSSQSIFGIFFEHLENVALERGCDYVVGLSVSHYAQIAKQGSALLREVKYADYVDPETGLRPDLNLSPIHTHAKLYYWKVPLDSLKGKL